MKKYFFLFLTLTFSTLTFSQNVLTAEKLWELGRVSLNDISPDGQTVLFGLRHYDLEANSGSSDLYAVSMSGGKAIQLTDLEGSEGDAMYRPDGLRIGFLHKGKLHEMTTKRISPKAGGNAIAKISDVEMNGFKYSPDQKHLLFIADVKYDKSTEDRHPDLKKAEAMVIDDLMYRHWNQWEDGAYSNIFVASYDNGNVTSEPKNIMGEPYDSPVKPFGGMEQIAWSPDGKMIAYTCKKVRGVEYTTSTNSDIYLYDLTTGKTRNLTKGMMGYDMNPAFSPDGRYLAWESMETPGYEADRHRVFTYDFRTEKKVEVTAGLDHNASNPAWSKDGKRIYVNTDINGTRQIAYLDLQMGNELTRLSSGQYNFNSFAVAKGNVVASRCSMSEPHELVAIPTGRSPIKQLTNVNREELFDVKMGEVKKRTIKTTDGKDMLTWVIFPPNFDPEKKYPTLLYCQGGPQSQVSQFWSYRWNFQMMAANGYIVVAPNRRGLPGFGTEWNEQISGDWGGQCMKDYLSAIDEMAKEPYVDEDNLGAVGASFGGYSVYWLAGNHGGRFKSFISHCGLFNLESWYGTTEEMFFANHDLGGAYWAPNPGETWKLDSPHKYVQNWDTPMLVIHGGKDFRVPESEGMQAFQAAKLQGVPSKFLYFPNEGHWVQKPQNSVLWQREFFSWLDSTLKVKP